MDTILSVRQLNQKLKQVLDIKFPFVWVKGEVTNLARPSSGHIYFSLKDGDDLLNCVWFRNNQEAQTFDPLTGEVWEDGPKPSIANTLRDGQELVCAGKLTVYAPRGQYQLVVELAQETGIGQLYANFEALKKKLSSEGLFDSSHKKPLPKKIHNVALITAKTGAVIQDFIRISNSRGIGARIHVYPSLVQGDSAPKLLINALLRAQHDTFPSKKNIENQESADIIVLIRGGGSIEDLWAFNDENLARAIHACPIPIVTGIGHEPDLTIADYVADLSMATPSHVAQILWQDRNSIIQQIDDKEQNLTDLMLGLITYHQTALQNEAKKLQILSPQNKLLQKIDQVQTLKQRLKNATIRNYSFKSMNAQNIMQRFKNLAPQLTQKNETITSYHTILEKYLVNTYNKKSLQFEQVQEKFIAFGQNFQEQNFRKLEKLHMQLEMHSPLAPLEKGYILVEHKTKSGEKKVLRSAKNVNLNDILCLNFKDGMVESIAQKITH